MSGPPLSHSATSDATVSKRGKRIFLYFIPFFVVGCVPLRCACGYIIRSHISIMMIGPFSDVCDITPTADTHKRGGKVTIDGR